MSSTCCLEVTIEDGVTPTNIGGTNNTCSDQIDNNMFGMYNYMQHYSVVWGTFPLYQLSQDFLYCL